MDLISVTHSDLFTVQIILVLALVLSAEFINGWTDAPNAIATIVTTGALRVRYAISGAAILNALGAATGTAVAVTIGKGIVASSAVTVPTIGAAMVAIIGWGMLAANRGWPVSKSHALLAGIAGAAIAGGGFQALIWSGWKLVLYGMLGSLIAGFGMAFAIGALLLPLLVRLPYSPTKKIIDYLHITSAGMMAFAHGMNDGQKFIGIFALVLSLGAESRGFSIPLWVVFVCSLTMALGTSMGGWKIIETVGKKMGEITSWQGLVATTTASTVIIFASHFGIPLSTTHTITAAIAGANASRGLRHVQWLIIGNIIRGWLLTFPSCAAIAFIAASLVRFVS